MFGWMNLTVENGIWSCTCWTEKWCTWEWFWWSICRCMLWIHFLRVFPSSNLATCRLTGYVVPSWVPCSSNTPPAKRPSLMSELFPRSDVVKLRSSFNHTYTLRFGVLLAPGFVKLQNYSHNFHKFFKYWF